MEVRKTWETNVACLRKTPQFGKIFLHLPTGIFGFDSLLLASKDKWPLPLLTNTPRGEITENAKIGCRPSILIIPLLSSFQTAG